MNVKKILRASADLLLLLALAVLLYKVANARLDVLNFYFIHHDFSNWQKLLVGLPSFFFYVALAIWYGLICRGVFAQNLFKLVASFIFLVFYLVCDGFWSVTFTMGSGQSLFGIYYFFTQFNILHFSYKYFAVLFYSLSVGFVALTYILFLLKKRDEHKGRQWLIGGSSALLFIFSFVQLSDAPRFINLTSWPYALSSNEFTPSKQDFFQVEPELHEPIQLNLDKQPNIVLIVLESTRKDALSFYNPQLKRATPFFDELAEKSAVFTQMQTIVPFTLNALVSINCGITSYLNYPILESTLGIPRGCLAKHLLEKGYETRFMQTASVHYGNIVNLNKQLGYSQTFTGESFDTKGFQWVDFTGYDDRSLLAENKQWLEQVEQPFMVSYLTVGPHWPYTLYNHEDKFDYSSDADVHIPKRYQQALNHYRNAVYYQDKFLASLFQQFESLGLLENSVFILIGDHGSGFGEHAFSQRFNNLYQEALAIPFLIYAPSFIQQGEVYDQLLSQSDVVTVLSNLLNQQPLLADINYQATFSSCWYWRWCVARTDAQYKFIHNFGNGQDELYDLTVDILEQKNIADQQPQLVKQFREQSLRWHKQQLALYGAFYYEQNKHFYLSGHPVAEKPLLPSYSSLKQGQ